MFYLWSVIYRALWVICRRSIYPLIVLFKFPDYRCSSEKYQNVAWTCLIAACQLAWTHNDIMILYDIQWSCWGCFKSSHKAEASEASAISRLAQTWEVWEIDSTEETHQCDPMPLCGFRLPHPTPTAPALAQFQITWPQDIYDQIFHIKVPL